MELKLIIPGHYYITENDGVVLVKRINRDVPRGYWDEGKKEWIKCEPQTGIEAIRMRDHMQVELKPEWFLEDMHIVFWDKYIHEKYVDMKRIFCIIFAMLVAVASAFSQTVSKNVQYSDNSQIIEMYGIQTSFDNGLYDVAVHCSVHNGLTEWFLVVDAPENTSFVNQIHMETDNNYCVYLESPYRMSYIMDKPKMAVVHGTAVLYQDHTRYKRSVFRITERDLAHIQSDGLLNVSVIDKQHTKYTTGKRACKYIRTYITKSHKTMQKMLV